MLTKCEGMLGVMWRSHRSSLEPIIPTGTRMALLGLDPQREGGRRDEGESEEIEVVVLVVVVMCGGECVGVWITTQAMRPSKKSPREIQRKVHAS